MKPGSRLVSLMLSLAFVAGTPAAAAADPERTIAGAATVQPGVQHFGTTLCPDCSDLQYWKLALISGDRVAIDWQTTINIAHAYSLRVFPAGTNDFSINVEQPEHSFFLGPNAKMQARFTASTTGIYPLRFSECCSPDGGFLGTGGGPYDFVTYVRHAVRLFIAPRGRRTFRRISVPVKVRDPDGNVVGAPELRISLSATWGDRTRVLGTMSTDAEGVARFVVRLPRSTRKRLVRLTATSKGTGYLPGESNEITVRVRGGR